MTLIQSRGAVLDLIKLIFFLMYVCLVLLLIAVGCAHRSEPSGDYLERVTQQSLANSNETTIVFLIDGLSHALLVQEMQKSKLPQINNFFLNTTPTIPKARAIFPSVTFTNIAGLLLEQPVHKTEALGNKIIYNNELIDFESVADRPYFTKFMQGRNIFARLKTKNWLTVGLDYGLTPDATSSAEFDLKSGYAVSQLDYVYLDQKKISSLEILLNETTLKNWPQFIFIHLVGLDFISHRFGPNSIEAMLYLQQLDNRLKTAFTILKKAEVQKKIVSLLTADHGFTVLSSDYFPVESFVKKIDPALRVVNESRFAGIYFLKAPAAIQLVNLARESLKNREIEIVAFKELNRVRLISKRDDFFFDLVGEGTCLNGAVQMQIQTVGIVCSDALPVSLQSRFYPNFVANMASYFTAPKSADVILIPNSKTVFSKSGRGFHGGPTDEEMTVPLLIRNGRLNSAEKIPPTWQALKFIGN